MTSNACKLKPRCVVGLFGSPMLGGTLFGLQVKDRILEFDRKSFPCCDGLGLLYDEEANATSRCAILKHLKAVRAVYSGLCEALGRDAYDFEMRTLNMQLAPGVHQAIQELRSTQRAAHITSPKIEKPPQFTEFWVLCLAAAWRYGMGVVVANFAKKPAHELAQLAADPTGVQLIALSGLSRLSDPAYADAFESLVSVAYHGEIPLVLDGVGLSKQPNKAKPQSPVAGFNTKGMFKHRAEALKNKQPLGFVQRDCRSRLQSLLGAEAGAYFEGL